MLETTVTIVKKTNGNKDTYTAQGKEISVESYLHLSSNAKKSSIVSNEPNKHRNRVVGTILTFTLSGVNPSVLANIEYLEDAPIEEEKED